jgi:hypothetical protein
VCAGFFAHDGEYGHPGASAPVLLGEVDADEPVARQVLAQFARRFVSGGTPREVCDIVFVCDGTDRVAQVAMLGQFSEFH